MKVDRRTLFGAICFGVAGAGVASAQQQNSQTPATPPQSSPSERVAERALQNRYRLEYDGRRFTGPAWDLLVREGTAAHAFLLGEEHGIAENPKFAAQLVRALRPAGYDKVCVEVSPPMAEELDRAARDGIEGVRAMFADVTRNVAFFGMREEAEWIADARAAIPGREQAVWALDYEVFADRRLIARLKAKRKPAAAARALDALEAASNAAWAQHTETRNPQFIFSFSGDPELVRAVRSAWPRADEEARLILETIEETLEINRLFATGRNHESNQRRNDFNKRNLLRYWQAHDAPKVFYKFGASHMVRGLSHTMSFDIGTLVPELLALVGGKSFHLMVLPGAGSSIAQFDPTALTYRPQPIGGQYQQGLAPITAAAFDDAMTLVDMRPIRPLITNNRARQLDDDLVRVVHGFDAVLVMTGSTASANLMT
ncbi:MAG: hypothetical protein K2P58_08620 [Hyphomonadaceae bacterium]|nr:hypothetical protein [Hyphomonadaceae bacterium]